MVKTSKTSGSSIPYATRLCSGIFYLGMEDNLSKLRRFSYSTKVEKYRSNEQRRMHRNYTFYIVTPRTDKTIKKILVILMF